LLKTYSLSSGTYLFGLLKTLYGNIKLDTKDTIGEIMNNTGYIKINSDNWEDVGKIYKVHEYFRPKSESTAVHLVLEFNNETIKKVVPYHWIEWIEDGDW
jgi:hypothetical protein